MNDNKIDFYILTILLLGIIWALEEVYLGGWVKSLHIFPAGLWISSFAVIILVVGKQLVPTPGSIFLIGTAAALIKFLLTGSTIGGPFIAVIVEALIGELVLTIFKVKRFSSVVVGVLVLCYTALHPIIQGSRLLKSRYYLEFKRLLSPELTSEATIEIIYLTIHIGVGVIIGLIAWYLSNWLKLKLIK